MKELNILATFFGGAFFIYYDMPVMAGFVVFVGVMPIALEQWSLYQGSKQWKQITSDTKKKFAQFEENLRADEEYKFRNTPEFHPLGKPEEESKTTLSEADEENQSWQWDVKN